MAKAISLLSGGLDSILATVLMKKLGVDVEAVTFMTPFMTSNKPVKTSSRLCERFNIAHHVINLELSEEYLEVIRSPKHGYGKNINPCIDCHIFMIKKAAELMQKVGGDFIVTGEVAGERPMSQRKDIFNLINKETGLNGLILRPLSAKVLKETVPEKEGWVEREKLLGISGRSRKRQFELAKEYNIKEYPSPAGGCLLTDEQYCRRLGDLLEHKKLTPQNANLLKVGRHFRLDKGHKLILGRNKAENDILEEKGSDQIMLVPVDIPGPSGVFSGNYETGLVKLAASILMHYTKAKKEQEVRLINTGAEESSLRAEPADRSVVEKYMV